MRPRDVAIAGFAAIKPFQGRLAGVWCLLATIAPSAGPQLGRGPIWLCLMAPRRPLALDDKADATSALKTCAAPAPASCAPPSGDERSVGPICQPQHGFAAAAAGPAGQPKEPCVLRVQSYGAPRFLPRGRAQWQQEGERSHARLL